MVEEVRLNRTVQHLSRQELRAEIVRIINATQRGTVQFRDLETFVFCREELARRGDGTGLPRVIRED